MSRQISKRGNALLWAVQGILALLFLFAGGFKESMSVQALAQASGLNGWFMRFIGLAEIAGALGLVLPGIFGIRRQLTPVAAAGLVVIMVGAVVVSVLRIGIAAAVMPALVGIALVVVIRGRLAWSACRSGSGSFDVPSRTAPVRSTHS